MKRRTRSILSSDYKANAQQPCYKRYIYNMVRRPKGFEIKRKIVIAMPDKARIDATSLLWIEDNHRSPSNAAR